MDDLKLGLRNKIRCGQNRTDICYELSQEQTQMAVVLKNNNNMMIWPYELANLHNKPVGVDDSEEWGVIYKD
jgi:hypothetical protein